MTEEYDKNLKALTTFGVAVSCKRFVRLVSTKEITDFLPFHKDLLILGSGSNLLFTQDFEGTIVSVGIDDISVSKSTEEYIWLTVGAGKNWHELVMYCISQNYGGIENLSLIPGTVGASPIQNIGAYGVEIMDLIEEVTAYRISDGERRIFSNEDCEFSYRNSIFKGSLKSQYLISHVSFRLTKKNHHQINTSYAPLSAEIADHGVTEPSIDDVSKAVIKIRQSKLPDPAVLGNAGSFFKNPIVETSVAKEIIESHPSLKSYPVDQHHVKIPAAWLIDQCGWKGRRIGDAGVHEKHALVLVNYGDAAGREIFDLSEQILRSVKHRFDIKLEREVNVI